MRPTFLMLAGVRKENRHKVLADINDAVAGGGGWIIGHTLFSNIAITFKLILTPRSFATFKRRIDETGVRLDSESLAGIEDMIAATRPEEAEITTSLNVTFHSEADLRRDVPAAPD